MNKPLISIILPSVRLSQLAQCFASIEHYTVGIDYEVVVVSPFDIEPHPNVVYVKETKAEGLYRAVSLGYEQARGEYIIHIPDDTRATPDWAANMIAFIRPHDDEIFEGNFRHFDARGERPEPGYYGKLFAPFLCIRRDKADRIGGLMDCYYKRFFGDADLSLRVWHNGGRVETCPDAWIYHADCNDEIHKSSYNSHFIRDREAFVQRWHHIYARPGDGTNFYTSQPIEKQILSRELPPEECVRLYISMRRRDWKTVKNVLISNESDTCIYPESLPILYSYVVEMLHSPFTPRTTLYSVLEWLQGKGYTLSPSDVKLQKKLLMPQRVWSAIMDVAIGLSMPVRKRLREFVAVFKGKKGFKR